jgi:hypothetical protein
MHSALGEYTPVDEFVALLDYIDELEAQLTPVVADICDACARMDDCGFSVGSNDYCHEFQSIPQN